MNQFYFYNTTVLTDQNLKKKIFLINTLQKTGVSLSCCCLLVEHPKHGGQQTKMAASLVSNFEHLKQQVQSLAISGSTVLLKQIIHQSGFLFFFHLAFVSNWQSCTQYEHSERRGKIMRNNQRWLVANVSLLVERKSCGKILDSQVLAQNINEYCWGGSVVLGSKVINTF